MHLDFFGLLACEKQNAKSVYEVTVARFWFLILRELLSKEIFICFSFFLQWYRARDIISELSQLIRNTANSGQTVTAGPATAAATATMEQVIPPTLGTLQMTRPDLVSANLTRLFQPYQGSRRRPNKLTQPWQHKFFCCSRVDTHEIPDLEENMCLQASGLGARKVLFCDAKGTAQQFLQTLENTFPPLKNCRGFKIMRCCRSRQLIDVVMPPGGYTAEYIKNRSTLKKAVAYIVPLQNDLPLNMAVQQVRYVVNYLLIFLPVLFSCALTLTHLCKWHYRKKMWRRLQKIAKDAIARSRCVNLKGTYNSATSGKPLSYNPF